MKLSDSIFQVKGARLPRAWRRNVGERAFTMVEIAISLAVVAFALVAILGVLPTGLQVQRDNREETIINSDGAYILEAIRSGNDQLGLLTNVYLVSLNFRNGDRRVIPNDPFNPQITGQTLLGLLGTPKGTGNRGLSNVVAWVRALNSSAIDRDPDAREVAFRYQLTAEVQPYLGYPPSETNNLSTNYLARLNSLQNHLYEVRLTFQWPLFRDNVNAPQNARVGLRRRTFRTLVAGTQVYQQTNLLGTERLVFYFQPSTY